MSGIVEQGWQTHTARCRRNQALLLGGGHPLFVVHPCGGVAMDGGEVRHVAVS